MDSVLNRGIFFLFSLVMVKYWSGWLISTGWFCKPVPLWCFCFRCRYRLSFRQYNNPHSLHGKKLSLLCFLTCLSRCSFLVKRFWHTPQVKVLWCLFRRWCSINWLFLAKVCWQYPQECICKRQMYRYLQHESNSSTICQINFIC